MTIKRCAEQFVESLKFSLEFHDSVVLWFLMDLCVLFLIQDGKTKFKRLKKGGIGGEKGSGGIGLSDEDEEDDGGGRRGRTAEEELKRSLFGEDDGMFSSGNVFGEMLVPTSSCLSQVFIQSDSR